MERIQFRRDTAANWRTHNPVLAEGELGIETDTKLRKVGDGSTAWNNLDYLAAENIVQELGDSENAVISQKAISTLIGKDFTIFGFINKKNGTINNEQEPNIWKVTPYLKIDKNYNIIFCGDSRNQYINVLAYYDADKNYISGLSNIAINEYEFITVASRGIPENARYIRVCYKVEMNNAFVSYTPFTENKLDIVVDVPRGKNLFKNFYASGDVASLVNTTIYDFAWGIKRDRTQSKIKVSESSTNWDFLLDFYDVDFQKLNSAIITLGVGESVDIPATCEYIVFSAFGYVIKNNSTFMVNYGEETLPYEEYESAIFEKKYDDTGIVEKIDNLVTINSYDFGINGYLNDNGIPSTVGSGNEDAFRCTGLLKIDASGEIHYKGDSKNKYNNVLAFYNANKELISLITNIDSEESEAQPHTILPADIPENTRYIRLSKEKTDNTAYVKFVPFTENQSTLIVDVPKGKNIYNVVTSVADWENNTLYQSNFAVLRNKDYDKFTVSVRKSNYYLRADFYDVDWVKIGTESQILKGDIINIPDLCTYIVFSDYGSALIDGNTMVNYGEETLPYEEYENTYLKRLKYNWFKEVTADTLTDGNISLDAPNVKWGQTISFWARVTTMGKITLSHGKVLYAAGMVDIDGTNITTYTSTPTQQEVVPHGLTIASFIEVTLSQKEVGEKNIMLYIRTLGGSFEKSIPFGGCRDDIMCEAQGCNLTECKLTFSCKDYNKDIWMFGDSYFDFIPSKLVTFGYANALFDAYSGRNSKGALTSLKKMIGVVGVPKIIYWALGMNDADTESSANANWNDTYLELKEICSKNNVELVLATIPNVPNRSNAYKNSIVRLSRYRYVDNDKAVGGDLSSNWYSGLLGADQVHPTDEGAQVLAQRLILELPEIKD